MPAVKSRLVLYFPGFDPLDAAAHHLRYQRAAVLSGKTWDVDYAVGPLENAPGAKHSRLRPRRATGGHAPTFSFTTIMR